MKRRRIMVFKKKRIAWLAVLLIPAVSLIVGATVSQVWAQDLEFDEADVYAELNNTDGDLGFHGLIDGEDWKRLMIEDPNGKKILNVRAKKMLRRQGLTELFFESAEPTFDELSPEAFFNRFPAGMYEIEGVTLDGEKLESEDLFRHVMPAAPDGIWINTVSINLDQVDCDDPPEVELTIGEDVVIAWDEVNVSHPEIGETGDIEVAHYQVVVEFETPDEFESTSSIFLPADVTEATIPFSTIDLGLDDDGEGEFKFEILVKEDEGGNQTATESCFVVVAAE
jgi:hypothetical protein